MQDQSELSTTEESLPKRNATTPHLSCGALAQRTSRELDALFRAGAAFPLSALNGDPSGRALATPGLDLGLPAILLRLLYQHPRLPWEGKTFAAQQDAPSGVGVNRVRLLGRKALFPFRTYPTTSVIDGHPALAIDYDIPENPALIRPVYDEVRKLEEGLYLGRGMYRIRVRSPLLLIWFALDARAPDARVVWSGYAN